MVLDLLVRKDVLVSAIRPPHMVLISQPHCSSVSFLQFHSNKQFHSASNENAYYSLKYLSPDRKDAFMAASDSLGFSYEISMN